MDNQEKLVSIGMPTFNGISHIRKAIDSLLSQTYRNFEFIISDNASNDGTSEVCQEYARKDGRIKYIKQKKNISGADNFNFLLQQAKGEYFMWASDDDVWGSRFIEECVEKFNADKEIIMVFSNFANIDENGNIIKNYIPQKFFAFEKDIYRRLKKYLLFYVSEGKANLIHGLWVRKELVQVPIFGFSWGTDINFIFRSLIRGRFGLADKMLFFKRVKFCSPSKAPIPIKIFRAIFKRIKILFSRYFYTYFVDILLAKQLNFIDKLKLFFYNFLVAIRLFLNYKV